VDLRPDKDGAWKLCKIGDLQGPWLFERGKEQFWKLTELGFDVPFKTITGGIFEVGFPDVIQQIWTSISRVAYSRR
jgi:hypothetical protein